MRSSISVLPSELSHFEGVGKMHQAGRRKCSDRQHERGLRGPLCDGQTDRIEQIAFTLESDLQTSKTSFYDSLSVQQVKFET